MLTLLQHLTPAETLLITQLDTCKRKQLMRFTFLDLLLREVLVYSKKRIENEDVVYIKAGSQLQIPLLPHERIFTDIFIKSPDLVLPFKMLVKVAYKNAGTDIQYKRLVRRTERLAPAIEHTTWGWLTGSLRLTQQGEVMRKQAGEGLQMLEKHLPNYIKSEDKPKAIEWIRLVTGNIFLATGINWTLLRLLGDDLHLFDRKKEDPEIEIDDDLYFIAEFLDDIATDFDSGCGSDDGGGSDGGGDSGCGSGCGGGCGGGCGS